jgi:hypothetical protein
MVTAAAPTKLSFRTPAHRRRFSLCAGAIARRARRQAQRPQADPQPDHDVVVALLFPNLGITLLSPQALH